ncbi:unnamed protein product, partial [Symbiodinium pilosum]
IGGFVAKPLPRQITGEIRTLHVLGRQDTRVPAKHSLTLAARYAHSRLFVHLGGHSVPSSNVFRSVLREFLLQPKAKCRFDGMQALPVDLQLYCLWSAFLLFVLTSARRLAIRFCAQTRPEQRR